MLWGACQELAAVESELVHLDAESKEAHLRLTYALLQLDRSQEAMREARKLRSLDRDDPRYAEFVKIAKTYRRLASVSRRHRGPIDRWITLRRLILQFPLVSRSDAERPERALQGQPLME